MSDNTTNCCSKSVKARAGPNRGQKNKISQKNFSEIPITSINPYATISITNISNKVNYPTKNPPEIFPSPKNLWVGGFRCVEDLVKGGHEVAEQMGRAEGRISRGKRGANQA